MHCRMFTSWMSGSHVRRQMFAVLIAAAGVARVGAVEGIPDFAVRTSTPVPSLPLLLSPFSVNTQTYASQGGLIADLMQSGSDSMQRGRAGKALSQIRELLG